MLVIRLTVEMAYSAAYLSTTQRQGDTTNCLAKDVFFCSKKGKVNYLKIIEILRLI